MFAFEVQTIQTAELMDAQAEIEYSSVQQFL